MPRVDPGAEWLEADGLGGFASGTTGLVRTRRYHALLLAATTPPTGRFVLVNGLEAWVELAGKTFALSAQRYAPDVIHPDGASRVAGFTYEPWPHWTFALPEGARIEHEILAKQGVPGVVMAWRAEGGSSPITLKVRPLLSGRDYHSLHHENPAFNFNAEVREGLVVWRPYPGVPGVAALSNGSYQHAPDWYRRFLYTEEQARGLDCIEDLASPGVLSWDLRAGEAWLRLAVDGAQSAPSTPSSPDVNASRTSERARRASFASPLRRAADAYVVQRGSDGRTIIAGYPWFTDWGRDTFISLRGLCIASGRLDDARRVLIEWSRSVSQGMLPNRFPDHGEAPEFNSVDASLWFVVAVHDFLSAVDRAPGLLSSAERQELLAAVDEILEGYARGTRYGIRLDDDGLLAAGVPGVQLTWMDAKVGDHVITPRIGKPVEVQALWLNALEIGGSAPARWAEHLARGSSAFLKRFWDAGRGHLCDVVDVDHQRGRDDPAFRPNQVLAIGGLPFAVLDGEPARRVVDAVERRLWTPIGLRSLAPGEPGYAPHYQGGVLERDGAYHQGTVWPWLAGPFVEAWVRVRGDTPEVRAQARKRFLEPILQHLQTAGLGHLPEIADAEAPHRARGCPFQAWSVAEALRLEERLK